MADNKEQIRNIDQLQEIIDKTPFHTLADGKKAQDFVTKEGLNPVEFAAVYTSIILGMPYLPKIVVDKDSKITLGEIRERYEQATVQFIILHRVYSIVHLCMIELYDVLERDHRIKFKVKFHYQNAEKEWDKYEKPRRNGMEKTAWFTLQDHLRVMCDMLHPRIEKVYEATRDYMIRLGWRDVEVKARIEVAYLMCKVAHNTFKAFFKDFREACGVDFTKCFEDQKINGVEKQFVLLAEALGVKPVKSEHMGYDVDTFNPNNNQRVMWAWDDFLRDLRDEDLMDDSAKKAIELNPKVREEYHRVLEEAEQEAVSAEMEKLEDKFKVTKLTKK